MKKHIIFITSLMMAMLLSLSTVVLAAEDAVEVSTAAERSDQVEVNWLNRILDEEIVRELESDINNRINDIATCHVTFDGDYCKLVFNCVEDIVPENEKEILV